MVAIQRILITVTLALVMTGPAPLVAQTQRSAYEELQIAPLPVWSSAAADSGFVDAVPDSVAQTLPATAAARTAWLNAEPEWRAKLVPPFLSRVCTRLGVSAVTDSLLDQRLARILATRVAEVRWGPDAREEFLLRNDRTVRVALEQFPRLSELLQPKR